MWSIWWRPYSYRQGRSRLNGIRFLAPPSAHRYVLNVLGPFGSRLTTIIISERRTMIAFAGNEDDLTTLGVWF